MSSIITFAANNDLFRKRKRVYRACESCKKRRKRCTHTFDGEEPEVQPRSDIQGPQTINDSLVEERYAVISPMRRSRRNSDTTTRSRSTSPSQFYGRTRPETLFLDQTSGVSTVLHECGYWMPGTPHARSPSRSKEAGSAEDIALEQYLTLVNVDLLPPQEHLDALIKIYFEYVHPILPIVDSTRPGRRKSGKLLSPMLLQTICIIAARHDRARPHLVLQDGDSTIGPRDFAKRLYKSVNAALNAKLERDRTVLIQVLALLSLYVEGTEGAEIASIHLSEAIHHAHTIGMQFGRARDDERAEYFHNFYWCLWSLDRLNSTMNGRPIFISDADIRLDSPLVQEQTRYTPFGIFLQITSALDHIINYYRPRNDSCTGWEKDFPGFEEMLGDKGADINPSLLAFLELLYHSAAIMSHKARPINEPVSATPSFVRQSLSTVRVLQILRDECPNNLPPLPIVPWAVSLAMAHAYRVFRQSKIASLRNRARNDLQLCCDALEKMRSDWWSAGTMADLGRAALKKASAGGVQNQGQKLSITKDDTDIAQDTNAQLEVLALHSSNADSGLAANTNEPVVVPSQIPSDMGTIGSALTPTMGIDPSISPDWLNFDTAFENFDAVLGSSGADVSMDLLRPFNFDDFRSYEFSR